MTKKKLTEVRAKEALRVFLPRRIMAAPGARTYILDGDTTIHVDEGDRFIAKRIKVGDLVVVKQTRATKPKAKPAGETKKTEG